MNTDDHAPRLARDVTHARIGNLLHDMRETVDVLIAIRVRAFGELLDGEEAELLQIKGSLDFLRSDIREARIKKVARAKSQEIQDNVDRFING